MSLRETRVAILAIGTELTTGQTLNRNAAWISEKVSPLGLEIALHETVPDDRALMLEALERCARSARFVFVSGGLGPTSDDFTRDVVAEFVAQPMEFHKSSWEHIQQRLNRLGVPIAPSNRQQCFFPRGSIVIPNSEGTANAFSLEARDSLLWILPGPPNEVEAVWNFAVSAQLREHVKREAPALKPLKLFTWQCMGKSEAELGEITERALNGTGLAIGYRAHRPFVEIKVWCPEDSISAHEKDFARLEKELQPWIASKQGEDLAARFLKQLRGVEEVEILDGATGGILVERVNALLRGEFGELASRFTMASEFTQPETADEAERWVKLTLNQDASEVAAFTLAGFSVDGSFSIGMRFGETRRAEILRSPYAKPELCDRSRRFAAELALKTWAEWIGQTQN